MPKPRKDTCPSCKTINADNWIVCCKCGTRRPAPCKDNGHPSSKPFTLSLNRAEGRTLVFALQQLIKYGNVQPGEPEDAHWRRVLCMKKKLKEVTGE